MRPVTNEYFLEQVVDPFRWMENASSPEVREWMKAQNQYARGCLERLPARREILAELQRLDSTLNTFPGALNLVGKRWFYMRTPPPADVYQLFMRDGLDGIEKLVFDPQSLNTFAGSHHSLNIYHPAPDAKHVICRVSAGGSENSVLLIVETDTGRLIDQPIDRVAFGGVCWMPDARSLAYSLLPVIDNGLPATTRYQKRRVYLHELGREIENDRPLFGFEVSPKVTIAENHSSSVHAAPGSAYMIGEVRDGVGPFCELYLAALEDRTKPQITCLKVCSFDDEVVAYSSAETPWCC